MGHRLSGATEISRSFPRLDRAAFPFLRRYFPGYDVYLWLDGDTWVQDAEAIEL
ncbi:MAG: hypothetical protein ACREED_05505 [Stellaceae bacterium]